MEEDKNKDAKDYLKGILATFKVDPADSMYQAGYEACTKDTLRYLERLEND